METKNESMNKFIKYPLIFIGVVATIGIVGFGGLQIYWTMNSQDEPVPDDSDLIPVITEIPDEENAYFEIIKAQDALAWPKEEAEMKKIEKILKNEEWDEKFVTELLEKNKTALEHFEKASTYSKFRDIKIPINTNNWDYEMVVTSLNGIKNTAKVTSVQAQYLLRKGKEKEAFDSSINILKIGQLIQNYGSTTIGYLIGRTIKGVGIERIKIISREDKLKSSELLKNISALESFIDNEEGLSMMWKSEYTAMINSLEKTNKILREGRIGKNIGATEGGVESMLYDAFVMDKETQPAYHYKPNQTRRIFSENTRILISNAGKKCSDAHVFEREYFPELFNIFFTENSAGKTLVGIWVISLQGINDKKCTEDANIIEVQLMLALKAYEQDKGKKPNNLEDLVPDYIAEIPIDPFTGKIVEYSPEKGIMITKEALNNED